VKVLAKPAYAAAHTDPVNALLYTHVSDLGLIVKEWTPLKMLSLRYDILHVHWPDNILSHKSAAKSCLLMQTLFLALDFVRAFGRRVVWTMHNIQSHDKLHPRLEEMFWRGFTRRVDGLICPSERLWTRALASLPQLAGKPSRVVPQGPFTGAYPQAPSRQKARAFFGIPNAAEVILFIGRIRPYKNVDGLIRAFSHLSGPNRRLIVAGVPKSDELRSRINQLAGRDERVILHLHFIADKDVPYYLSASDLVVLPFLEISNSGSALLALSFDRPILAPNREAILDLQENFGSTWVKVYAEAEISPDHLAMALCWAVGTSREAIDWKDRTWSSIAEATKELYQETLQVAASVDAVKVAETDRT